jgi:Skp family chaperone for outer membrane proteins
MALVDDVVRPWAARCVQPLPHPTKQEHSALASRADRAQELEVMVEELEALVGCLQPLQAERDEADEHAKQLQQQV